MIGEEEVLGSLRKIANARDPVPAAVLAAARASLAWRDPDGALAELVADSAAARLLTVRGGGPRLLTFRTGPLTIEVQATRRDGIVEVQGELDPAQPARLVVESPGGRHEVDVDRQGRFKIDQVASGPVRLRCTPAKTGAFVPVRTEWVLL